MTEIEKAPDQQPEPVQPVKASQKFAAFLSYHLQDNGLLEGLPMPVRVPFKAMLTWTMKHRDELFTALGDDDLDEFFAQYADLLLQLRSDDAIAVRVIALQGWDADALAAFEYFHAHRAEISEIVEKRASENDEKALEVAGSTQVPGQLSLGERLEAQGRSAGSDEQPFA